MKLLTLVLSFEDWSRANVSVWVSSISNEVVTSDYVIRLLPLPVLTSRPFAVLRHPSLTNELPVLIRFQPITGDGTKIKFASNPYHISQLCRKRHFAVILTDKKTNYGLSYLHFFFKYINRFILTRSIQI